MAMKSWESASILANRAAREGEAQKHRIAQAHKRIVPVSLDMPGRVIIDAPTKTPINIVDDFMAVVDARANLTEAMYLARCLLHDFECVALVRNRSAKDIQKTMRRMHASFDADRFGGGQKEAFLFPRLERHGYMLYRPTMLSIRQYTATYFGLCARWRFGEDIDQFARAQKQAFPEYLNTTVKRNSSHNGGSKPGWIHTDGPVKIEPKLRHGFLPKRYLESLKKDNFTPLPGEATITMVLNDRSATDENDLNGAGTILINSAHKAKGKFFQDIDVNGYQLRDGDIAVMRGEGWPDHPQTGAPRPAAEHASALGNRFGVASHLGRMLVLTTSKVSYVHPLAAPSVAERQA